MLWLIFRIVAGILVMVATSIIVIMGINLATNIWGIK